MEARDELATVSMLKLSEDYALFTYVTNVDYFPFLSSRSSAVREWVRGYCCSGSGIEVRAAGKASTTTESEAATAAAITTTLSKSTTKPASHATTITTATWEAHSTRTSVSVLTDFQHPALPVIPVELLNSIASVVRVLEYNDTGTFGTAIRANMNICTDDAAHTSWIEYPLLDNWSCDDRVYMCAISTYRLVGKDLSGPATRY